MTVKMKSTLKGYMLILPYLVGLLIFYCIPYLYSLFLSFTEGAGGLRFAGLKNYSQLLQSEAFLLAARNTVLFTFTAIPTMFVISLAMALMLNDRFKRIEIYRSIFVVPLILPTASFVIFWQLVFNDRGILNEILNKMHMSEIRFFNSDYAMAVVVVVFIWQYVGYAIILFLSGLNSIDNVLYEAAMIDGASGWQKFRKITLPLLQPTAFLVVMLSFVNSLKVFRVIYLMCGPYPHRSLYMLQHFMNNNMRNLNYQRLSTASFLISFVVVSTMITLYYAQKRTDVI